MNKAQNLQEALSRAINAVNFGTTSGQQVSSDNFTIKNRNNTSEDVLVLNGEKPDKKEAERVAAFWGALIRKNYDGDFIVRMHIEKNPTPVEIPFINWMD